MGKTIFRTILFLLIFALLFGIVSHVLVPKGNAQEDGIHNYWAKGFLAEPEDTIDVLALGDSELYSCLIPLVIWEEHGITSYTCGTSDQKLYQTESYLKRVFQTQSPKVVLLETNILFRDYSTTDRIPHFFEELLPLVRYHDRWKNLTFSDLTDPIRFTHIQRDKGYMHLEEILPADDSAYMIPTDDIASISSKNLRHVRNILDFCQAHGAQLILFSSPSTANWDYARHNRVVLLAQELGVEYIDTNLMPEEIPIDWEEDTRDHGDHMNYTGAKKVSEFMARYLDGLNLFEDKRAQVEFASWNEALADFLEVVS